MPQWIRAGRAALTSVHAEGSQLAALPAAPGDPDRPHRPGPGRQPADRAARALARLTAAGYLSGTALSVRRRRP